MKRYLVHLIRLVLICFGVLWGMLSSAPALAQSAVDVLGQPSVSKETTSLGSAKDLLGQEGKPIFKHTDNLSTPSVPSRDRLKQVTDSINNSLDQTKTIEQRSDRLQVDIKLSPNSRKNGKQPRLPVGDR